MDVNGYAKLCDFGLAKYMEGGKSGLTPSNNFPGSIRFMAPELCDEHPYGTKKSDNWAWCCLGLEVSTAVFSLKLLHSTHGEDPF